MNTAGENGMSATREKYFDQNGLYDENEEFLLIEPNDTYKDAYFDLCKETYVMKDKLDDEEYRRLGWGILFKVGIVLFVIEKGTNNLCGYVELKHIDSEHPEIGIELFKKYQRQGIGYKAIKLMLSKAQQIHPVSSYKIRIYYDNISSQKLFEKLGAVKVGEEEGKMTQFMREAKEVLSGKALDDFTRVYKELTEAEPNAVYVYDLAANDIG